MTDQENNKTILEPDNRVILTVDGHRYDVTCFDHPGDGFSGIFLEDFNNKDVSEEFDHSHFTDYPFIILMEAQKLGEYEGVKYLGEVEKEESAQS